MVFLEVSYPTEKFLHWTVVYTSMWHAPGGQSRQNSRHPPPKWVPNNLFSLLFIFYNSTDTKASPWYSAGDAWFDPDEKQKLLPLSEEHRVKFVFCLWRGTYSSGSCDSVKVVCLMQPLPITDSWSWWSSIFFPLFVLQGQSSPSSVVASLNLDLEIPEFGSCLMSLIVPVLGASGFTYPHGVSVS